MSYRPVDNGLWQSGSPGYSNATIFNLETDPSWVRLVFVNDQSGPMTITNVAIALTSEVGNGYTPVNQSGANQLSLFQSVTFNNGGADLPPNAQNSGSATSASVPGYTSGISLVPTVYYSDWIKLAPNPRIDGGFGALLLARCYSTANIRYMSSTGFAPDITTRAMSAVFDGTPENAAASPYPFTTPQTGSPACSPYGIDYIGSIGALQAFTVLNIGDSILSGYRSGYASAFTQRACIAISTASNPVNFWDDAYGGINVQDFITKGYRNLAGNVKPNAVVMECWSVNDSQSTSQYLNSWAQAIQFANYAAMMGCPPILCTAAPVYSSNPTNEVFRVASNALVRGQTKYPVLDLDSIWGTGASPNAYQPQYGFGDGTHQNDAANAAAAAVLAPMLSAVL